MDMSSKIIEDLLEMEEDTALAEAARKALKRNLRPRSLHGPHQGARDAQESPSLPVSERFEQWRQKNRARPEVRALVEGARRTGLTHEQLARVVGVSVYHMRALLYGRVAGQPAALLEKFRAFERREAARMPYPQVAITPIQTQLRHWRTQLGLDDETEWHLTLSDMLGIRRATIYRWLKGVSQPYPHTMRILDIHVEKLRRDIHDLGAAASMPDKGGITSNGERLATPSGVLAHRAAVESRMAA